MTSGEADSWAVELTNVTKRFGKHTAVRNLDLRIPKNSIYGFIGPNGSGKTTTIRMILRIFRPDEGLVSVLGEQVGDCADDRVGYLPEERGLYRRMKVRELLRYYARLKGFRDCDDEITRWLERLGAGDWGEKKIEGLSKGMAQKISFISAVIAKPQLLILDEPFSGLDPVNLETLRDAILEVRQQARRSSFPPTKRTQSDCVTPCL
ncbi:MAG: ATP-binding cassette domain-containing protein [Planctomycetaceae bacterium]